MDLEVSFDDVRILDEVDTAQVILKVMFVIEYAGTLTKNSQLTTAPKPMRRILMPCPVGLVVKRLGAMSERADVREPLGCRLALGRIGVKLPFCISF